MTLLTPGPLIEMDGRRLYYTFIAGARKVIQHQIELNKINVFPVKDGDTGTNLASTIRAVVDSLMPHRSYKITADRIAETTLINARGNSGIIFAQFFYGISCETGNLVTITLSQFAESLKRSVRYIYDAVANPVEGTMLTVIRDWAEYVYDNRYLLTDFNQLFLKSLDVLQSSLLETRKKISALTHVNVVDAGARGFVLFIEGIIDFITRRNLKELILSRAEAYMLDKIEETIPEKPAFRYCTEALVKNSSLEGTELRNLLEKSGNSIVIAGSENLRRLHVHTDNPAILFDELRRYGTLTFQKADDMIRQSDIVYNRKWNIALVTDSTCDLSPELLDRYQVNLLPININFGENNYLDKLTIQPEQFYKLLDESPDYPKSAQVNEKAFVNLYSHLVSHYDSVIAIHLSDKLSGTYNSSRKAAQAISTEFNKKISVINSKNISGCLGLLVLKAAEAIEQGLTHDDVVNIVERSVDRTGLFVNVATVRYLIKGGRVPTLKGYFARFLNILPVITIDKEGNAIVIEKALSRKASMERVMRYVTVNIKNKGIWNYIILHANNFEAADWYNSRMEALTGKKAVSVLNISPVIGANTGTGAAAVAFLPC